MLTKSALIDQFVAAGDIAGCDGSTLDSDVVTASRSGYAEAPRTGASCVRATAPSPARATLQDLPRVSRALPTKP